MNGHGRGAEIFLPSRRPHYDSVGRTIYKHAVAVPYTYSETIWKSKTWEMKGVTAEDVQIVLLPLHKDATATLAQSFKDNPIGPYGLATHTSETHPDGEINLKLLNINPRAKHVYIVGSLLSSEDFHTARALADHCKSIMNIPFVTMVCPSIGKARQDKNVKKDGSYDPTTLNIKTEVKASAPFFDNMIVFEPHSSATQAFAAQAGMPLLPISLWKPLTDHLMKRGVPVEQDGKTNVLFPTPENAVVIRPDKGRNLAAKRIEQQTGISSVSFSKVRLNGNTTQMEDLTPEEQAFVRGRIGIAYDDEVSTMGTAAEIMQHLDKYGLMALAFMVGYGKLIVGDGQNKLGWEDHIQNPLLKIMLMSNAREPIGDPSFSKKVEEVDIASFIREIIEADIRGVDFWRDHDYSRYVLQEKRNELL